jgi:hypothetical protein
MCPDARASQGGEDAIKAHTSGLFHHRGGFTSNVDGSETSNAAAHSGQAFVTKPPKL